MATCDSCGEHFERQHYWQRLCWSCWRAKKDREQRQEAYNEGYCAGLAAGRKQRPPEPPPHNDLDDELLEHLPRLIQLCHPDRHDGSAAATAVTQWLLELRTRTRATNRRRSTA